jgi:hypothetical protein
VETGAFSRAPHQVRGPFDPDYVRARQQRCRIGHVRPVADRAAGYPGRGRRGRDLPAPAGPAHHLVFGHRQRGRRDIEHLHRRSDPARGDSQVRAAPAAGARLDDPGLIRPGSPRQARTRMAFLPALRPGRAYPPRRLPGGLRLRLSRRAVLARGLR